MNRRRNEPRTPFYVIFALILAAAIAAGGGVLHVIFKNRQIAINREIDAIDRRIEQYRFDIRTTDMRMDDMLNRFAILKQIKENASDLRPIPLGVVEQIEPSAPARHSVASSEP